MKSIILVLIILSSILKTLSLRQENYCKITQKECKGTYDYRNNYEEKCKNIKCGDQFGYQCNKDFCSIDKHSCDSYQNLKLLIKSIKNSNLFQKQMNRFYFYY